MKKRIRTIALTALSVMALAAAIWTYQSLIQPELGSEINMEESLSVLP